ncbi:imidazole glycerol phosphate synthase subunit HisF [Candidatus Bathyarchaeota archaeon]|nr:imidazole glycerol phosphate synthase subunit HisF [Candidatus Bathyarchaeota archaeon]
MLVKRIIPCLDVKNGRVVKGTHFQQLRDAGNPVELGKKYSEEGADELVFLDITASNEKRKTIVKLVKDVATELDIPFTVGGGINHVEDVREILLNGADKTSLNTAAIKNPELITEISARFGSQCVVIAIDAKRNYSSSKNKKFVQTLEGKCWFEVYIMGGQQPTGIDALSWANKAANLGAGEILLTSIDRDGTKKGFDIELTKAITGAINIPVIASGGAGESEHFLHVFTDAKADAALAASVFHYQNYPIPKIKQYLKEKGVNVRI